MKVFEVFGPVSSIRNLKNASQRARKARLSPKVYKPWLTPQQQADQEAADAELDQYIKDVENYDRAMKPIGLSNP